MYIKYRDFNYSGCEQVRVCSAHHLCVVKVDCEEENGITTHGAAIQDRIKIEIAQIIDAMVENIVDYVTDGEYKHRCKACGYEPVPFLSDFYEDECELMWFSSEAAAQKVFDDICTAMDSGKHYFDLTLYGEDGEHL